MAQITLRHPADHTKTRSISTSELTEIEPLLIDILHEGKRVYELPTIEQMRHQRKADIDRLDLGVRRLVNPHIYHVSLTQNLWDMKQDLIRSVKQN
jgi:nicotinate phosphoribosyltransferase